eukprot:4312441-Pyramimonas_sp.AAC.1
MRAPPLGPSVELYGATKRCARCGGRMRAPPLGPLVEFPMGPRNAGLGVADACGHPPTVAFGGAPYEATKRCA